MEAQSVTVSVTGAAGQIGYALLFRLVSGEVFGPETRVNLNLIEIDSVLPSLEGVVMELEDCAFENLGIIEATSDLNKGFNGANWAILVGSVPRKAGMERKDLLEVNGGIFKPQGEAIEKNAASDVRIFVVGNPCNTNCLIAKHAAKSIPSDRFYAMTMLDQNRAKSAIARKCDVTVSEVKNLAIWGNHSSTQYPDALNSKIGGKLGSEILDLTWIEKEFIPSIQQRGAKVIEKRGASSAASAANGVINSIQALSTKTQDDDFFSVAVSSDGSYGIEEGLIFGFPVTSDGVSHKIVSNIKHTEFALQKIEITHKELQEEKEAVKSLGLI